MVRERVAQLIAIGTLIGIAWTAWAATQEIMPGDVIANRKRLMRLNGASMADIQAKMKAGNIEAAAVNAETIAINAAHIPALFPADSLSGQTRAKPDIEPRREEFRLNAMKLQTAAEKLRDAARAKDAEGARPLVQELSQACAACHTAFRGPEP